VGLWWLGMLRILGLVWSPCPDPVLGDRAGAEAVETLIVPRSVDLGEMEVRRALPSLKRQMVGPFIFFDQMGPAEFLTDQGIDVRPHPHLYTIEGEIEVAGDTFAPGQLLVLRPGDPISVRATSDARFMLFGGAPMGGPRYIWWNFVSSRPERIEQAKEEWAGGRFDTVPGDEEEFIPLPKTQDRPRRALLPLSRRW
jgi:redox-sensitive bicupin YhaK (pirin superfamily)